MEGRHGPLSGARAAATAFGLAVLGLVGCSSSGSDAATTNEVAATTVQPTTSSSADLVDTTVGPATTAPATEPTATTTIPATTEPATTAPPDVATVVREAIERSQADFSACLVAMPTCDPSMLEGTRAGNLLARNVERINEWNALGYTVRDRDQYRYVIEAIELSPDERSATATVCIADGSKLVLPAAEGDVIIDGTFVSGRAAWDMRLDPDGDWRAYDAPAVGESSETDQCGG